MSARALRAGCVDFVGAGPTEEEAYSPFSQKINGVKVAVLNFAEHESRVPKNGRWGVALADQIKSYKAILESRRNFDFTIVIYHGGNEDYHLPSPRLQALFRFYIDLAGS